MGGAKLAIINLTSTPYDPLADLVIRDKAGLVMEELGQGVRQGSKKTAQWGDQPHQ